MSAIQTNFATPSVAERQQAIQEWQSELGYYQNILKVFRKTQTWDAIKDTIPDGSFKDHWGKVVVKSELDETEQSDLKLLKKQCVLLSRAIEFHSSKLA